MSQERTGAFRTVQPLDPLTFVAVPLFLAAVAFSASLVPAIHATAVEPATALRHE